MTSVLLLFECLRSVSGLCVLVLVLGVKVNLVWPFEGEVPTSVLTHVFIHIFTYFRLTYYLYSVLFALNKS